MALSAVPANCLKQHKWSCAIRRAVNRSSNTARIFWRSSFAQSRNRFDSFFFILDDKPGDAVVDDLRDRASAPGNHRRSASHCLDHHQAKRFGPVDGKQKSSCVSQKLCLFLVPYLPNEVDAVAQKGLDLLLKVPSFRAGDFGRDL